jgi:hypothetical protein
MVDRDDERDRLHVDVSTRRSEGVEHNQGPQGKFQAQKAGGKRKV